ncbi:MAG: protein-L-isoaspartate(D-aspartate) O-methyltransferase [Planctomycetales bacterium]
MRIVRRIAPFVPWLALVIPMAVPRPAASQSPRDPYAAVRERMVDEYIVKEGIANQRVISAMKSVPRHEFVPGAVRNQAYLDGALAIGHQQTISPPYIVAYMTAVIDPQPEDKVLEIGTGSGYQAAVLSPLAKEVYTIEIVPELGQSAAAKLKRLGYANVSAKVGDGYKGWPEHAPFDKIIVTCSPEKVPEPLVEQLKEGGKMIIPLGERYQQVFHLLEKKDGKLVEKQLVPTLFVPMTGISEEKRAVLPDPASPKIVNGGFEVDANEDGRADNWHYQRQTELISQGAPAGERFLRFTNFDANRLSQGLQGLGVDGRRIRSVTVSLLVKHDDTAAGAQPLEQPALMIHFYDSRRDNAGSGGVGPWLGTRGWHRVQKEIPVPATAREAVIRIGLNGATGTLDIDDLSITPNPR